MTNEEFEKLVNSHDLTYGYSDDGNVWRRGQEEFDKIKEAAKTLDPEFVRSVWNAKVDRTLAVAYRAPFYWKG